MMQKPLKIRPPCHILADNFITGPSLKNLNIHVAFFDQVAVDVKSVLTSENCPLVAELKFKIP